MTRFLLTLLMCFSVMACAQAGASNSLMDVHPDGAILAVANTDSGTVSLVDLKSRLKLAEIPVGDHPEGVCWVRGGKTLFVSVYGEQAIKEIDPGQKAVVRSIRVDHEPYGIVATADGLTAYVSHDFPGTVSELDVSTGVLKRRIKVGPACRGLALSADQRTLYATEFFTTRLHAIDVATGAIVNSWSSHETDNLARHVVTHPTRPRAYLAHLRSRVDVFSARGSIVPQLSIVDTSPKERAPEKPRTAIALDTFNGVYVMANPWESAISPDGTKIYIVYAGSNDASVIELLPEYPDLKRIALPTTVGKHPRAVRVSPDGQEVYIANTLDFAVTVWSPDLRLKLATIPVCDPPKSAEWRRGKELFQTSLQPMGGTKWVSCSSCHPDGLSDGRVWNNPEGPRRTPHLFGLAHTHPLHWSADRDEVQDFEYTIRGKLMQGRGLATGSLTRKTGFTDGAELKEMLAGRSKDLDALALYTNAFDFRLSPFAAGPGRLTPDAERGKAVFLSKEANCASCHSGPYYTDSKRTKPYNLHDVGTGGDPDIEKMGPKFDTPTLLGVYRMGPYLHDGRAKTLDEVLTVHNANDQHGKTSHLSKRDVADLVAFLKSLPFEMPPDQTPNTVK